VSQFIDQERRDVDYEINGLMDYSPYRKTEI